MGHTRRPTSLRLDLVMVERARVVAGLPDNAPMGAVVRYALAHLAGADTGTALDSTPGRGAVSYRTRQESAA